MADKPLVGQVAVVTGASEGIGAAICEALASSGASVVMGARSLDKLENLKSLIEKDGGKAIYAKTDVTVRQEVKDLVKFAEDTFGPVDILVNNAGVLYYTLLKNLHEDEWERIVDVNCKGFMNGIGAVIDGMVKRKRGHIIALSSENGKTAFPGFAVYSGSKFFVEGVCRGLRQEVCKDGVRVTCIEPGDVDTPMFSYFATDPEATEKFGVYPASVRDNIRILDPADVARTVVFALTLPDHVAINEVLIQPTENPTP